MLWRYSELDGYEIAATDGTIGSVDDLLFDEAHWTARWLVVDTGSWLSGRRVLLPPSSLGHPDGGSRRFPVTLTRQQIEESPPVTADLPVSRQVEAGLYDYYGWAPYWDGDLMPPLGYLSGGMGAGFLFPPAERRIPAATEAAGNKPRADAPAAGDRMLQSIGDTTGHAIRATDGDIGHVEDFLVEEDGWRIRYMVVDTRNWLPGRKVLISPHWIHAIDWSDRRVQVDLSRQAVKDSPEFQPEKPIARAYEAELHGHYRKEGYWPPRE